jgi:hypothetical protein
VIFKVHYASIAEPNRRAKGKAFFFAKKNQKNAATWGMGAGPITPQAQSKKVFLLLFVHKKKRLLEPDDI